MLQGTELLTDNEIYLELLEELKSDRKKWAHTYKFRIFLLDGRPIGDCDLRMGHSEALYEQGNIGYAIDPIYRGNNYAEKACYILFKLAKRLGMSYLIVTCDCENIPSRKTIENAGGKLLEILDTQLSEHPLPLEHILLHKCIYKVEL